MADDVTYPIPDGTIQGTDTIAGVVYPRAKVVWGPDGTVNDTDIATGKPMPVQVRSATGLIPLGEPTDAKSTATDTTSVSAISALKQISSSVQTLVANSTALGQTTKAGSVPVTMASDQNPAHDAADSITPVKVGGRARSSEIAAVSNNDVSDLLTDLVGKLIVLPYANPENFVSGAITSAMTGTTSTSLIAAPASGLRNYITQITVSCAHATQGTDIIIQDGSGGTTLYTIPAAALYGGACVTFPAPLRQPTTATAIFCANVTTGSSTKVSASGYKGA